MDKKIRDCTWEYLSGLETLREPREGMPRLLDLLRWMNEEGKEDIWVLLDVKVPALPSVCSRTRGGKSNKRWCANEMDRPRKTPKSSSAP